MFNDALHFLTEMLEAPDWERLGQHLPFEWVEQAIANTGTASIRKRRLPAEQVVWLVVALALYRHKSVGEVLDDLELALPDAQVRHLSKSAAAQARQRLGAEPLRWLFEKSGFAWAEQDRQAYAFKGLQLLAMDGTTLRTHDNPELRSHFGAQEYLSAVSSYPQVRGVTVTALPTHLIRDAEFGPYGINEMVYAKALIPRIPDNSLTVFDKGFLSAEILWTLMAEGDNRHFVIPSKSNTKWEVVSGTEHDATVRMRVSPQARTKCPNLPAFWEVRAITVIDPQARQRILLTSLMDRRRFRAADIVAYYDKRWSIETSYRELKQSMLGMALTLRSKTVTGVYQEIWGTLTAYNLIRLEIAKAALAAKCEPQQVSFVRAFHIVQFELHWAAVVRAYGKLPSYMKHLRSRLVSVLKEQRPGRSYDRAVKARPQRYTVRFLKRDLN